MTEKTTYNCLNDRQRIEDIFEVCTLFPEKNKLNDFDRKFIIQVLKQTFMSQGQNKILVKIERKVFGIERDREESKNVLR